MYTLLFIKKEKAELVLEQAVHSRESNAKFVKEQSQTMYVQFDHA